jgi:hypothetical protein
MTGTQLCRSVDRARRFSAAGMFSFGQAEDMLSIGRLASYAGVTVRAFAPPAADRTAPRAGARRLRLPDL